MANRLDRRRSDPAVLAESLEWREVLLIQQLLHDADVAF
jgi:hypothetical protein